MSAIDTAPWWRCPFCGGITFNCVYNGCAEGRLIDRITEGLEMYNPRAQEIPGRVTESDVGRPDD